MYFLKTDHAGINSSDKSSAIKRRGVNILEECFVSVFYIRGFQAELKYLLKKNIDRTK